MRKFLIAILSAGLLCACGSVQEAQNLANCKYALRNVELTDYNLTSLGFEVVISITNVNKKQAASLKRFEGKMTVNDEYMADVTLKNIVIEPNSTKNAKAKFTVPMSTFNNKLLGLISMNSATLDYHLSGTMYFEGPLGVEIPMPVELSGSYSNIPAPLLCKRAGFYYLFQKA